MKSFIDVARVSFVLILLAGPGTTLADCDALQALGETNGSSAMSADDLYRRGFVELRQNPDWQNNNKARTYLDCAAHKGSTMAGLLIRAAARTAGQKYEAGKYDLYRDPPGVELRLVVAMAFISVALYDANIDRASMRPQLSDWLASTPNNYAEAAKWESLYSFGPGGTYHAPQTPYRELAKLVHCDKFEPAKPFMEKIGRYLSADELASLEKTIEHDVQSGNACDR